MNGKPRSEVNVVVVAGGTSSERDISWASGQNALQALREAGYERARIIDAAADDYLDLMASGAVDVAFLTLHGAGGEDGVAQGVLEYCGVPYTGSGIRASANAADKAVSKVIYEAAGIEIAPGIVLERDEAYDARAVMERLGGEVFVKPAVNGSSYGISLVKSAEELPEALERAFEFDDKALVEHRVRGIEVTAGVLGGERLRALPVVEIRYQNEGAEYYDLNVKYISPEKMHQIPAELPTDVYERVQELACAAHRALGCWGISRSDFIIEDGRPVILETNTLPGMTETSLIPDAIRHTDDLTFPEACAQLVELALRRDAPGYRHRDKK